MMLIAGKRGRGGSRFALVSLILLLSVLAISVQAQGVQNLSVDELRSLAGQGDAAAQFELGHRHADGRDVVRDDAEALRWFRLSAEQGHAGAQHNLAFRYAFGQGVPLDDAEAVRWYRLAAEQGHADAQFNLASRYARGRGVPRDDAEAVRWYRLAAEQGDVRAQLELGFRYANGQGVAHDCAAAASLLRPLASKGYAGVVLLMDRMLLPVGGTSGATGLSPQVQADLLEAETLAALEREDYPAFLSNLCAFEALGHAERLTAQDRAELLYHRAVGLRATGKPKVALMALNEYLNTAGSSGNNYQQAIMMLRPLQGEAK